MRSNHIMTKLYLREIYELKLAEALGKRKAEQQAVDAMYTRILGKDSISVDQKEEDTKKTEKASVILQFVRKNKEIEVPSANA